MPVLIVTAPSLTDGVRADLAHDLTKAVAELRAVAPDKVQLFFREGPVGAVIVAHVIAQPEDELAVEHAIREASAQHLAPGMPVHVDVQVYAPDHTAKAGQLRTNA